MSRFLKINICFFFTIILFLGVVFAQDKPKGKAVIALFPLKFYGPSGSESFVRDASVEIKKRLELSSYRVLTPSGPVPSSPEDLIKTGKSLGARYLIYGSVSKLGSAISIDLRGLDVSRPQKKAYIFFAQGEEKEIKGIYDSLNAQADRIFSERPYVAEVATKGNRRVGADAILQVVSTKAGDILDENLLSFDIKAIYQMDFFEDVQVDVEETPLGTKVTFLVREKPAVKDIIIKGASQIKEEKVREVIDIKPFSVIKEKILKENTEKIKNLYAEKGYATTSVSVSVKQVSEQAADVVFDIDEGEKIVIKSIDFVGNKAFSDKELESLMETTEKRPGWLPTYKNIMAWLKGDISVLNQEALDRDLGRVAAYYHNHGYIDARVGRPAIKREDASIFISIPVEEGDVYKVGELTMGEAPFKDKEKLLSELNIQKQKVFNREVLRQDIIKLTDACADLGYAYCEINPKIKKDVENRLVNVNLLVDTGPLVTFSKIDIVGNTSTRDKVIRRELRVSELEPFSATGLKKSKNRLRRLGYFEDVSLNPTKGETEDTMNLEVQVKERPTGSFSVGAGYSSVDHLILMGEITQRNFLGKGQTLSFKGIFGSSTNRFALTFIEPYLWDTRFTFGTDLYNWEREYDDYTKESTGGAVNFGYPISENLKFFWGARIDNTELSDVADDASQLIKDSVDIKATRALNIGLKHDSRNDFYYPTRGWVNSLNVEYAGGFLGGDSAFVKFEGVSSYYHPLWWKVVSHIRGGLGYVTEGSEGKLPVYERFYLGGIDSVRGYKFGYISPVDPETDERIGGNYMAFVQLETIFPLIKDMGLNGVVFFDTGNVWDDETGYTFSDLRKSVGAGIRWLSPMGPLRVEWGYNIDKKPGDDSSNWEFRMGGTF